MSYVIPVVVGNTGAELFIQLMNSDGSNYGDISSSDWEIRAFGRDKGQQLFAYAWRDITSRAKSAAGADATESLIAIPIYSGLTVVSAAVGSVVTSGGSNQATVILPGTGGTIQRQRIFKDFDGDSIFLRVAEGADNFAASPGIDIGSLAYPASQADLIEVAPVEDGSATEAGEDLPANGRIDLVPVTPPLDPPTITSALLKASAGSLDDGTHTFVAVDGTFSDVYKIRVLQIKVQLYHRPTGKPITFPDQDQQWIEVLVSAY